MSYTNILADVKLAIGITGTYQDGTIQKYIDEVKFFMLDGGVDESIVNSSEAVGVIARGVSDLWNYGSGGTDFSPYFIKRVTQLAYKEPIEKPYTSLNFIKNYFNEISYDNLDYDFAYEYLKKKKPIIGACSSIRNGNFYGRCYDWKYDELDGFLVRTSRSGGRYASIGFASAVDGLTGDDLYMIVPFMMLDGINECGVIANINVVPTDRGITTGTVPEVSKEIEICSLMLVRYILDHFESAIEAVLSIKNYMSVFTPTTLAKMGYETHLMVADETTTYLVEFIDNETVVTAMDRPYMTNFHLTDVEVNDDGTVYTPADEHLPSENNITPNGSGLERYNLIVENYATTNTKDGMRELLNKLKYTNAYNPETEPFWYTEFVGIDGLTVDSEPEDFADTVEKAMRLFKNRIRNGKTWHTKHSAVYDIENRKVSVVVQEDGEVMNFEL